MMKNTKHPKVHGFFDATTSTVTYVVYEAPGTKCAIIDPVLDYDSKSGHTNRISADKIIEFVRENSLTVEYILETHAHADHLSAMPYLKACLGGKSAIGARITVVQDVFRKFFNFEPRFKSDGSQFDLLLNNGDCIDIGNITGKALSVPGHTPACMAYQFGDAIFVGDTLFMPDVGSARCDFPGGDAKTLYASARKLLSLPQKTRMFVCHDYPPNGREAQFQTTVAEQRKKNIHLRDGISESDFVTLRTERDAKLQLPVLILPSVQMNIRAGEQPPSDDNGVAYLKIPLNLNL
jgi:glyoxylase-like metal-dependent hydrolase (beta-lactamase superfamily II)